MYRIGGNFGQSASIVILSCLQYPVYRRSYSKWAIHAGRNILLIGYAMGEVRHEPENYRGPAAMSTLCAKCLQGYRIPTHSISTSVSILSTLVYLSYSLKGRALSYSIYQPGGVSCGLDTRRTGWGFPRNRHSYYQAAATYKHGTRKAASILGHPFLPRYQSYLPYLSDIDSLQD